MSLSFLTDELGIDLLGTASTTSCYKCNGTGETTSGSGDSALFGFSSIMIYFFFFPPLLTTKLSNTLLDCGCCF